MHTSSELVRLLFALEGLCSCLVPTLFCSCAL